MSVTSVSISKSLCPIVDSLSNPRKCYYSIAPAPIWKKPADGSTVPALPCTLPSDDCIISITVDIPSTYAVAALLNEVPIITPIPSVVFKSNTDQQQVKLEVPRVPWAISGNVTWTLIDTTSKEATPSVTALEVHILNPTLPPFLDDDGVPLALLRFQPLMQNWRTASESNWPKFVTDQLFKDSRMTYENFKGMNKYTSWETDWFDISPLDGVLLNCWIELWLSDMNGLKDRNDIQTQYAVNCYDLTAIAQTIFALGTDISKWRVKYMEPFGYLKHATLIGNIGPCNNPYFGRPGTNPNPKCDPTDDTRSFIGNHMFLTSDNKAAGLVYDACVGPQLGVTEVAEYSAAAIDNEVPEDSPTSSGTLADIYDGRGVVALAVSVSTHRLPDAGYGNGTLLESVMEKLGSDLNTVRTPYIGRAPATGADAVVATFTINVAPSHPGGSPEVWTLSFFRFTHLHQVQAEFTRRRSAASDNGDDESLNANEWLNPNTAWGGFRMFYSSAKFVLVVIESSHSRSEDLGKVTNILKDIVEALPFDAERVLGFDYPKGPVVVAEIFRVSLRIANNANDWWFGYTLETSFGVRFLPFLCYLSFFPYICRHFQLTAIECTVHQRR